MPYYHNIPDTIEVVTPPAMSCLTVEEVGMQIRVQNDEEASLVESYIKAAEEAFRVLTEGRVIIATTFREYLTGWPSYAMRRHPWLMYGNRTCLVPLRLQKCKVTAITSVKYFDEDDVLQTLEDTMQDVTGNAALIGMPQAGWPSLSARRFRPVQVEYVAGFADADAVPHGIKQGIRSGAAHMFWQREAFSADDLKSVPLGFQDFCQLYRTGLGGL